MCPPKRVAGVTARYTKVRAFENYANEYLYNFDITNPTQVFNEQASYGNSYFPGFIGPGGRQFFPNAYGSPETVHSTLWNPALFWEHDIALTNKLSLLFGLREDFYFARARDPLPPPDSEPWHDAETVSSFSHNGSLLYRPTPTTTLYATYQRIRAANGNVTGGGVILNGPDGQINRDDFRNLSSLAELGAKFSLMDHRLFAAAALFDQQRTRVTLGGEHSDIRIRGLELETVYQPTTRLSATANFTYQEGHYVNATPFQLGGRTTYYLDVAG